MSNKPVAPSPEEQAKRFSEYKLKELEVKATKVENEYEKILRAKKEQDGFKNLNVFETTDEYVNKLKKRSEKQFKQAQKKMSILVNVPDLSKLVPFYAHEMFLMLAKPGKGKTTACRNIAYSALLQGKKPVVITNEENSISFINGLSSLFIGKRYANLEDVDEETKERLHNAFDKVAKKVKVIDADYAVDNGIDIPRLTNTIEGLDFILNKLMSQYENEGLCYDQVIVDYYQRFDKSIKNPSMTAWEAQEYAASLFENFRQKYPAPIVMFGQLKPKVSEEADYEDRIQGRKVIANFATVIIEMVPDRKNSSTKFSFHKGRNMEFVEEDVVCGWEAGKLVAYDENFSKKVLLKMEKRERKEQENGTSDERRAEGPVTGDSGSDKPVPKAD